MFPGNFWEIPLVKPRFGVTSTEVAIVCPWCSFSPSCLVLGSRWFWKHFARLFRQTFHCEHEKNHPSHTGHTRIWSGWTRMKPKLNWLVVSTPLKNTSQNRNLPQIGVKIKHLWNHHLVKKTLRSHPKDGIVDEGTGALMQGACETNAWTSIACIKTPIVMAENQWLSAPHWGEIFTPITKMELWFLPPAYNNPVTSGAPPEVWEKTTRARPLQPK